jgi:asparagine synthase (glutamine-hydrolysing)
MCGFAGVINRSAPVTREELRKCASFVSHRGPDSTGALVFDEGARAAERGPHGLFFNRLAIVDLDPRSDQPFTDDRHTLVFNGEIYNYLDLRRSLEKEGCRFRTHSDTEVLFEALKAWGPKALPLLNGMFAFIWIDRQERTVIVARDRVGIKPLYYRQEGATFLAASELHSILRLSNALPSVSCEAVGAYLWLQYIPTPFTVFEGIRKLPPGHYIQGKMDAMDRARPVPYWDAYAQASKPAGGTRPDLETTLRDGLELQLHADVPLGLFLSSGVDSSLLAAMVARHFAKDRDFDFFTVAYEGQAFNDEWDDANRYLGGFRNPHLRHHRLTLSSEAVLQGLEGLYHYVDEPFGDSATVLNYAISKKAREHVKVALSGDGADELFWGYPRYAAWKRRMCRAAPALKPIAALAGLLHPENRLSRRLGEKSESDPVRVFYSLFLQSGFLPGREARLPDSMWALEGVGAVSGRDDFPGIFDLKTYLADAMLYKVDRGSMAAALEVRVPYLDNGVIDLALRLPLAEKSAPDLEHKAPLKRLLRELAPHYDFNLPKKGFNFPVRDWVRTKWKERILASVTPALLDDLGLPRKPILSLMEGHFAGSCEATTEVWYLFQLSLWNAHYKTSFPASR